MTESAYSRALSPDLYTWNARITPTFIVLLPLAIACGLWFPDVPVAERLGAVLIAPLVLAALLGQLGRDMGYRRQSKLWQEWGGAPTTQLLRHRNSALNPELRGRYQRNLTRLDPTLRMPTAEEEESNPVGADHLYEAATRMLISKTRDRERFPLVYKENTNYGFRRNLWGLKPIALPLGVVSVLACLGTPAVWTTGRVTVSAEWLIGTGTSVLLLVCWIFVFTSGWVRIPATAYAERLFETTEELAQIQPGVGR